MSGIFRIARAELIKVFKKPSIYIMGVLLALVIVVLMITFSPHETYELSANLNGATIEEVHNSFKNESEPDSESVLNTAFYNSNQLVNFHYDYSIRLENIKKHTTLLIGEQDELHNLISTNKGHQTIINQFEQVEDALHLLINSFSEHNSLTDLDFYQIYLDSPNYLFYFNEDEDIESLGLLNELKLSTDGVNKGNLFDLEQYANSFRNNYLSEFANISHEPISAMFEHYNNLILENVEEYRRLVRIAESNLRKDHELVKLDENVSSYLNYITALTSNLMGSNNFVMVTEAGVESSEGFLRSILHSIRNMEGPNETEKHKNLYSDFGKNFDFENSLNTIKNNFKPVLFSGADNLEYLNEIKTFLNNDVMHLRQSILQEIDTYNEANLTESGVTFKEEFLNIISRYKVVSINTETYIKNKLTLKIGSLVSPSSINNYIGFNEFNEYKIDEETVKIRYQFDNNKFASDYITTFAFNQNSGEQTTFYDFMFYALKITSIFIIVFAIILSSNIMAFEFDTGTIKLLAIRPFKRWKILLGKLLSVMFFVLIFVLFSTIISFIAGIASFPGLTTLPAMIVFNASKVFIINPVVLMLIFIASVILEILFYATISLALSTIFKSFSAAMSSSILVLIVGYLLNATLVGSFWFVFVPFLNTDMFRFFGGSFIGADHTSLLSMFINSRLLSGSNFYISAGIYGLTITLFLATSYAVFRKRDI